MSDPVHVAIDMEVTETLALIEEREGFIDRSKVRKHLDDLAQKCIAYASEEPQEQSRDKRIVSFSDSCFHDPEGMIDGVNRRVNEWMENGGIIIRDPEILPQQSVSISQDGRTVYFYTVSVIFTEDVSGIPDDEPEEGTHNVV